MIKGVLLFAFLTNCVLVNAQPFFSEDFSSGIPAGWTNIDNSGNNVVWRTTLTGAFNTGTVMDEQLSQSGTSAANGYLILDSDSAGSVSTQNTDLTSVALNCTGHNLVHLKFNEYFAQFASSTGTVKVSNDNLTWVDVHAAQGGLVQDSGTANPYALDIDINSIAANQATVYIRFNYTGAYDYWWFVDDVVLYEPQPNDVAVLNVQPLNSEYTSIPLNQAVALTISGNIKNVGLNVASGGDAFLELVDVGSGLSVFSETVNLPVLNLGDIATVVPVSAFSPLAAGYYKSRISATLAGDGDTLNNVMESAAFYISDSVYQRDDNTFAGVQGIGLGPGENGTAGQSFLVHVDANLTSVTVFLKILSASLYPAHRSS